MKIKNLFVLASLVFPLKAMAVSINILELPALQPQDSPQQVVDEHLDALNSCDWDRLMAQYPPEVQIHLPNGEFVVGNQAVGKMFADFCRPVKKGGLKGLQFTTLHTFTVGDTVNVQWVADADFLAKPYKGADAYVTKDGFMYAQVTTFDGNDLQRK